MKRRLFYVGALALAAVGCVGDAGSASGGTTLVVPAGDYEAGRELFARRGCVLCHRATGEANLPDPVSTTLGPELGRPQGGWPPGELAQSIVDPAHRRPSGDQAGGQDSAMLDYSDELTVRELADLVAYLRYLAE